MEFDFVTRTLQQFEHLEQKVKTSKPHCKATKYIDLPIFRTLLKEIPRPIQKHTQLDLETMATHKTQKLSPRDNKWRINN